MPIEVSHRCGRTHRGFQSLAECTWPDSGYVVGDGAYAVLARCEPFTVSLYETAAEARRRLELFDARGCGRTCEGRHEVVGLLPGHDPRGDALLPLSPPVQTATEWLTS